MIRTCSKPEDRAASMSRSLHSSSCTLRCICSANSAGITAPALTLSMLTLGVVGAEGLDGGALSAQEAGEAGDWVVA